MQHVSDYDRMLYKRHCYITFTQVIDASSYTQVYKYLCARRAVNCQLSRRKSIICQRDCLPARQLPDLPWHLIVSSAAARDAWWDSSEIVERSNITSARAHATAPCSLLLLLCCCCSCCCCCCCCCWYCWGFCCCCYWCCYIYRLVKSTVHFLTSFVWIVTN